MIKIFGMGFNIKCILSLHKWKFYKDDIYLKPSLYNYQPIAKVNCNLRICERCYKKQREIVDKYRPYRRFYWVDSILSKSEIREKKLNELLKRNEKG